MRMETRDGIPDFVCGGLPVQACVNTNGLEVNFFSPDIVPPPPQTSLLH